MLGLDSVRFVLAAWVMIGHFGRLPFADRLGTGTLVQVGVRGIYNNLVSGPAAVIVFFVISGFCIHFPYRRASGLELLPYFARRHVRILIPVLVAITLAGFVGIRFTLFQQSILWSLLCEEIYYTLYPLLLRLRLRTGWRPVIAAAYLLGYGVVLTNPGAGDYPSYGSAFNWLLGLPCWLLGCDMAERWDDYTRDAHVPGTLAIWGWRLLALGGSVACSALRFHSPLTYPWTLNVFALLAGAWLKREILYFRVRSPLRPLEWGGLFSYSLYLVHPHGRALFDMLPIPDLGAFWRWGARVVFVIAVCYVFYLLVERPSHRLARRLYGLLMRGHRTTETTGPASSVVEPVA